MRIKGVPIITGTGWIVILALAGTAGATERLVVFGDSWGVLSVPSLQKTFDAYAPGNDVVAAGHLGEEASDMNTSDPAHGLPYITLTLGDHPTVDLVHLSIGGNDLRRNWTAAMPPAEEDALLSRIADDIEVVVSHIVDQRPDIEVFYSSYDYLRPLDLATPLEVNTVFEELQSRVDARLASIPRATTHSFYGLMQTLFGQSEYGIPPGDPSLPDINLPGPPEAFFDDIHLSFDLFGQVPPFGYDLLAEEQYAVFYQYVVPEPSSPAIITLAGCALLRFRGRFREHH